MSMTSWTWSFSNRCCNSLLKAADCYIHSVRHHASECVFAAIPNWTSSGHSRCGSKLLRRKRA
eukprot:scaffold9979_cov97-Skeletonema_marinoi.AAC.2